MVVITCGITPDCVQVSQPAPFGPISDVSKSVRVVTAAGRAARGLRDDELLPWLEHRVGGHMSKRTC